MPADPDTPDADLAWAQLKAMAEAGRTDALLTAIHSVPEGEPRITLYRSTIRHLAFDEWSNRNLDVMIALADTAIAECEALGGDFLQSANVLCYNMSANLADCWADSFVREPRHFEKGIEFAHRALAFRTQLKRGPAAEAMATWALGKHQQSLGRLDEARASFGHCLALAAEAAADAGKPAAIHPDAPDGYLIAAGYLALLYNDVVTLRGIRAVLDAQIERGGAETADAQVIVGQLRETGRQLSIEF